MSRGMWIRCAVLGLGVVPLAILLHVVAPPPNLAAMAVVLYAAATGIGIAHYDAKHPDGFSGRSRRR